MSDDGIRVAEYATRTLTLETAQFGDEYYYRSLPICVVDAVYSIGVRYDGVKNTVTRYCAHFGIIPFRSDRSSLPDRTEQQSITAFCRAFEEVGLDRMTTSVFSNRQRTSPRNGILKSDAVYRFALVLQRHGIDFLQHVQAGLPKSVELELREIPGQRSGVSLQYFYMLAGSDDLIKPDRMILRFLCSALDRSVSVTEAQPILTAAAAHLKPTYPQITPKLLDHEIWKHQRAVKAAEDDASSS